MKKTLFAALALAFVASCSNEEVVEMAQKEAIGFDNAFINNSTRSVNDPSITTDGANGTTSLANFAVFGFVEGANLFDGIKVAKDKTINGDLKSEWQYVGTQYWIAGANYNFYAVAPATEGNWAKSEATKDGLKLTFTNDGTKDVLYAKKNQMGLVSGNEEVKFDFNHILSKVKFSFQNDYNATNATIAVRDIKITNAHQTGTVTLNSSINWIEYTKRELELDFGNATDDESTNDVKENINVAYKYGSTYESQNERLVIPTVVETEYDVEFVSCTEKFDTSSPLSVPRLCRAAMTWSTARSSWAALPSSTSATWSSSLSCTLPAPASRTSSPLTAPMPTRQRLLPTWLPCLP